MEAMPEAAVHPGYLSLEIVRLFSAQRSCLSYLVNSIRCLQLQISNWTHAATQLTAPSLGNTYFGT
jgi:hypothetical protein